MYAFISYLYTYIQVFVLSGYGNIVFIMRNIYSYCQKVLQNPVVYYAFKKKSSIKKK